MSIPDYDALRAAVENEESILGLIGEAMCHPDYDALRAAVENEESILGLLNGAVQNRGTQSEEENRGWVTINGRHILLRDKDAVSGGGSAAAPLTNGSAGGKINTVQKMSAYKQKPPDFSKYTISENPTAVAECKKKLMELGIKESDIDLKGIKNADVLKPFVDRVSIIKEDTGMSLPAFKSVKVIDGDPCCIAGYKPYEKTFYISSNYFNSKEALTSTMTEWANNGVLPKQAKSISYLAEHEMAHIRISSTKLQSKEAKQLHLDFCRSKFKNDNDINIDEFYADSVANYRINPANTPPQMIKAVEYLEKTNTSSLKGVN